MLRHFLETSFLLEAGAAAAIFDCKIINLQMEREKESGRGIEKSGKGKVERKGGGEG